MKSKGMFKPINLRLSYSKIKCLKYIVLSTFLILFFQNCTYSNKFSLSEIGSMTEKESGTGNGGPYEGKPDSAFLNYLPGYLCNGKETFREGIQFVNGKIFFTDNSAANCLKDLNSDPSGPLNTTELQLSDIVFSRFQKQFISYNNHLFTFYSSTPTTTPDVLAEALCRDNYINPQIEFVMHLDFSTQMAFLNTYQLDLINDSNTNTQTQQNIQRVLYENSVAYKNEKISIEINFEKENQNQFSGTLKRLQTNETLQLTCITGAGLTRYKNPTNKIVSADTISFNVTKSEKIYLAYRSENQNMKFGEIRESDLGFTDYSELIPDAYKSYDMTLTNSKIPEYPLFQYWNPANQSAGSLIYDPERHNIISTFWDLSTLNNLTSPIKLADHFLFEYKRITFPSRKQLWIYNRDTTSKKLVIDEYDFETFIYQSKIYILASNFSLAVNLDKSLPILNPYLLEIDPNTLQITRKLNLPLNSSRIASSDFFINHGILIFHQYAGKDVLHQRIDLNSMSYRTIAKNRSVRWRNIEKAEIVWTQYSQLDNNSFNNLICTDDTKTYYTNLHTNDEQLLFSNPCLQNKITNIEDFIKNLQIFSVFYQHQENFIYHTQLQKRDGILFINSILTEDMTTMNFTELEPNISSTSAVSDKLSTSELCSTVKERKFAVLKSLNQENNYLFTYDKLKNYISFYRLDNTNCRYLNSVPFNSLQQLIDIQAGRNNFLLTFNDNEANNVLIQKTVVVPMDGRVPKIVHKDNANKSYTRPILMRSWNKVFFSTNKAGIENSLYSLDLD